MIDGRTADLPEAAMFHAGSTDESSVHIFLADEFGHVVGLHTATVLDAELLSGVIAEHVGENLADKGMCFLCLLRTGGAACAYGPDGLVGDDAVEDTTRANFGERARFPACYTGRANACF